MISILVKLFQFVSKVIAVWQNLQQKRIFEVVRKVLEVFKLCVILILRLNLILPCYKIVTFSRVLIFTSNKYLTLVFSGNVLER